MLFLCFVVIFMLPYSNEQNVSYKAAVVEFAPSITLDVQTRLAKSFAEYITFIKKAAYQNVDIIVFPEGGLTGLPMTREEISKIAIRIENTNDLSLCLHQNETNSQFLTNLSCVARSSKIYVVVNIIEEDGDSENLVYYSTSIVFNREGEIIATYRKINLYLNEHDLTKGYAITTFTTDFGVSFGIFTSNDIMFENPSLNILQNSRITNIIYSTVWYSYTSFYIANTIQQGYAKSNGVNLLAVGLCNPDKQNGGSGIYLHSGEISKQYISDRNVSKMLVSDVPIITSRRNLLNTCQNMSSTIYKKHTNSFNISGVKTSNYNYKATSLNLEKSEVTETICSIGHDFCCTFDIIFNVTGVPNYVYKLLIFKDALLIPLEGCGLVTCLNENIESCGKRSKLPPSGITFLNISIKTSSLVEDGDRPVMLLYDLTASNNYNYCKHKTGRRLKITMSTAEEASNFLVFGVFILDYNLEDSTNSSFINLYIFSTCLLIILTVVYKRCKN